MRLLALVSAGLGIAAAQTAVAPAVNATVLASAICIPSSGCKVWYGTATTNGSGQWSVSFPTGTFSGVPQVLPQALSADATLANSASASLIAQSATGASGVVTLPNNVAVLNTLPVKAAGAGLTVDVVAVGY